MRADPRTWHPLRLSVAVQAEEARQAGGPTARTAAAEGSGRPAGRLLQDSIAGRPALGPERVTAGLSRALAYADGAPPGFSGGFGEPSCHACHFDAEVNAPPGRLTVEGVPPLFTPGERYVLTVTLTRPGMRLAGFQMTARFADTGRQAGTLAVVADDRRVAIAQGGDVQYANQRMAGAILPASDRAEWTIAWTAPRQVGAVRVHVSANAADGDESTSGDVVYTTVVETKSAAP